MQAFIPVLLHKSTAKICKLYIEARTPVVCEPCNQKYISTVLSISEWALGVGEVYRSVKQQSVSLSKYSKLCQFSAFSTLNTFKIICWLTGMPPLKLWQPRSLEDQCITRYIYYLKVFFWDIKNMLTCALWSIVDLLKLNIWQFCEWHILVLCVIYVSVMCLYHGGSVLLWHDFLINI